MGTWPPGLLSHRSTHELYVCYLWGCWQKGLGKSTKINVKLKSCFDLRLRIWFFSRKRAKMNDWINKNALVISIMFPPQKSRHFRCYSYGNITWRIPGTGDPGGLPSMGSHRVGQDWSDLAAAAVTNDVDLFMCILAICRIVYSNSLHIFKLRCIFTVKL